MQLVLRVRALAVLGASVVLSSLAQGQSATFRDDCVPPNAVLHAHIGSSTDGDCIEDYDPGGPVINENWISSVQLLSGDVATILIINRASVSCFFAGGVFEGGLLCLGRYTSEIAFGTHCIPIPNDPSLIGLPLCSQGGSIGLSPFTITLSNALDVVIG